MAARFSVVVGSVLFALLVAADATLKHTTRSNITLVNNGYEGILIAIGEAVPEANNRYIFRRLEVRIGQTD